VDRKGKLTHSLRTAIHAVAFLVGAVPLHAEMIADVNQQVVRLNSELNANRPAATAADCFNSEHCLPMLVQEVGRAGGDIGRLARTLSRASPDVIGENYSYSFAPAAGESFCKAVLIKLSIAPTFDKGAPELLFSTSRSAAKAVVRLPKPENPSARVWFDGVLILLSVADPDRSGCTLTTEIRDAECKGGKCETFRF
jgi:hypothetical protein